MFKQVELKCFRQHEDLTVDFMPGIVAIRGRNEKGKTTLLEGMAYALGGATCLREALEDVVTWGRKPGELKVKMAFGINGVDYIITRSKSGAEIKSGPRILATGQKEVTKYVETLLGASIEVCTKLMLANQEDIKGALSKGPSAAIELIEALSNLGVIDTIIGLVQAQLPSGTTVSISSRIQTLEQQMATPVEDGTASLVEMLAEATQVALDRQTDWEAAKEAYDALQPRAIEAQTAVTEHERLTREEARLKIESDRAEVALAELVIPPLPTNIEELRAQAADAQLMTRAELAVDLLEKLKEPDSEWEGNYDSLLAELATHRAVYEQHRRVMSECGTEIARLEAQKITQTACGLCGKDLSKVPEVTAKNDDLTRRLVTFDSRLEEARAGAEAATAMINTLVAIQSVHNYNMSLFQKTTEFLRLDHGYVPPRYEWTGPAEITTNENAIKALQQVETAERQHHAAVGRQEQLRADVDRLSAAWGAALAEWSVSQGYVANHEIALERAATALRALNDKDVPRQNAQQAVQTARHALEVAQAALRERQAARQRLEKDLKDARTELTDMEDNNALIKFLREARPAITDQLWGMVMTTVSSYFSDIRGAQSVVTRSDNGFKVDGHNVAGLSGSTKDALGLAIRCALTKTFLPNASFMILDEASAACDDVRTAAMAGMVATANFEQILWVTHDDIISNFADQLISLET